MKNLIYKFTDLRTSNKLILLLLLGLILRFLSYYTHPYIHSDSVTYLSINHHDMNGDLQSGLDLYPTLPPAILYFMRLFSNFDIDVEFGYRVSGVILYSFAVIGFFSICRQFLSENASLFASFCYVCHPKLIGYSHGFLRETLAIPCMIFGLALFLKYFEEKKFHYIFLSGLLVSISYMSRIEYGVSLICGIVVFCFFVFLNKKLNSKKDYLLPCVYLVLSMIPLVLLAYLHMRTYESHWDPIGYQKIKWFLTGTL